MGGKWYRSRPVLLSPPFVLTDKEQTAKYSLGTCCSVIFKPVGSHSSDWPVELVFGRAQRSSMKKDLLCCHRAWPETAQPRFLFAPLQHLSGEIRHFSRGGKLAAAAPKQA